MELNIEIFENFLSQNIPSVSHNFLSERFNGGSRMDQLMWSLCKQLLSNPNDIKLIIDISPILLEIIFRIREIVEFDENRDLDIALRATILFYHISDKFLHYRSIIREILFDVSMKLHGLELLCKNNSSFCIWSHELVDSYVEAITSLLCNNCLTHLVEFGFLGPVLTFAEAFRAINSNEKLNESRCSNLTHLLSKMLHVFDDIQRMSIVDSAQNSKSTNFCHSDLKFGFVMGNDSRKYPLFQYPFGLKTVLIGDYLLPCHRSCPLSHVNTNAINCDQNDIKEKNESLAQPIESTRSNLSMMALAYLTERPVLIQASQGSGKSFLLHQLAKAMGIENRLVELHLDDQVDSKALLGAYVCSDVPGEFHWQPGILTQAVMTGHWILIEDIDLLPIEVLAAFTSLWEKRTLFVPALNKTILAHPEFRLFGTRVLPMKAKSSSETLSTNIVLRDMVQWSDASLYQQSDSSIRLLSPSELQVPSLPTFSSHFHIVTLHEITSQELEEVILGRFPKLLPFMSQCLLTVYSFFTLLQTHMDKGYQSVASTICQHNLLQGRSDLLLPLVSELLVLMNKLRPFTLRDVMKVGLRLSIYATSADINRISGILTEKQCWNCVQEVVDVFGGSLRPPHDSQGFPLLLRIVGVCFQLSRSAIEDYISSVNSNAPEFHFYGQKDNPVSSEISATVSSSQILKIGRVDLTPMLSSLSSASLSKQEFACTPYSLRLLERLSAAVQTQESLLLVGETGAGKTTSVQELAQLLNKPLLVQNLSLATEGSDLIGGFRPVSMIQLFQPVLDRFLPLFTQVFPQSQEFLTLVLQSFSRQNWKKFLQALKKACLQAFTKLQSSLTVIEESESDASTKTTLLKLEKSWHEMEEKIDRLTKQLPRLEAGFAFSFVDGRLVEALEKGHWILLDEINLASAETLQSLAGVLEGGSLVLTDQGELEARPRHPEFRLFAAMNPPNDVGKKELPFSLRSRFTEFYVPEMTHPDDLRLVVNRLLGDLVSPSTMSNASVARSGGATDVGPSLGSPLSSSSSTLAAGSTLVESIVSSYLGCRKLSEAGQLVDGGGQRPRFSLRSLTRSLKAGRTFFRMGLRPLSRAIYEGMLLNFHTLLARPEDRLRLDEYLRKSLNIQASTKELSMPSPRPKISQSSSESSKNNSVSAAQWICLKPFWIQAGPLPPIDRALLPPSSSTTHSHSSSSATAGQDVSHFNLPPEARRFVLTPQVEATLRDVVAAVVADVSPILLQGPTSVGKTSLIEYLAHRSGHEVIRINNHEHTEVQEYLGGYFTNAQGKLVYQPGLLVQALKKGQWLILDELNLAPSDVLEALNRLLDDNRELFIPETGETIRPAASFRLFATQNPPGLYGGRKPLSRAFRNRFIELSVAELPLNEVEVIVSQACQLSPSLSSFLVSVMKRLQLRRQQSTALQGKEGAVTLRDLMKWGHRQPSTLSEAVREGFMLLGERLRLDQDREDLLQTLNELAKTKFTLDNLYSSSEEEKTRAPHENSLLSSSKGKEKRINAHSHDTNIVKEGDKVLQCLYDVQMQIRQGKLNVPGLHGIAITASMQRMWRLVFRALQAGEPVLLVGGTGLGKTTVCQLYASFQGQKLRILNCHQSTETADILGGLRPIRGREGLVRRALLHAGDVWQGMMHLKSMISNVSNSIEKSDVVVSTAKKIDVEDFQVPEEWLSWCDQAKVAEDLNILPLPGSFSFHRFQLFFQMLQKNQSKLEQEWNLFARGKDVNGSGNVAADRQETNVNSKNREVSSQQPLKKKFKSKHHDSSALQTHHEDSEMKNQAVTEGDSMIQSDEWKAYTHQKQSFSELENVWQRSQSLFEWQDGPLVEAMKEGDLFLLDEVNLAEDAVLERLNSVLEASREITLAEKGGAEGSGTSSSPKIRAHPNFRFLATMNPGGDFGKRELSPALRSRFTEIWIPSNFDNFQDRLAMVQELLKIPKEFHSWKQELATFMIQFLDDFPKILIKHQSSSVSSSVTTMSASGNHPSSSIVNVPTISNRELLAWADFINSFPLNSEIDVFRAVIHGASMVFLDGLGMGVSHKDRARIVDGQRQACLEHFFHGIIPEKYQATFRQEFEFSSYPCQWNPAIFSLGPFSCALGPYSSSSNAMKECSSSTSMNLRDDASNDSKESSDKEMEVDDCALASPSNSVSVSSSSSYVWNSGQTKINMVRLLRAMMLKRPLLLEGPPGVGKSSLIANLAQITGHRLVRINLSDQSEISDLLGTDLPSSTSSTPNSSSDSSGESDPLGKAKFQWCDGVFLKAMKEGDWVLLDELNLAPQSVLEGLNSCFDHRQEVFLPEIGQTVHCAPSFRVFCAQNPMGEGGGRKGLPQSFLSRFSRVYVEAMKSEDLHQILEQSLADRCLPDMKDWIGSVQCKIGKEIDSCPKSECSKSEIIRNSVRDSVRNNENVRDSDRDSVGDNHRVWENSIMNGDDAKENSNTNLTVQSLLQAFFPRMIDFIHVLQQDVMETSLFGRQGGPWEFNLRDLFRWADFVQALFLHFHGVEVGWTIEDYLSWGAEVLFVQRFRNNKDRKEVRLRFQKIFQFAMLSLDYLPSTFSSCIRVPSDYSDFMPRIHSFQEYSGLSAVMSLSDGNLSSLFPLISHVYEMRWPLLLVGPSGSGKRRLIRHICQKFQSDLLEVSLTPSTDATDLLGSFEQVEVKRHFFRGFQALEDFLWRVCSKSSEFQSLFVSHGRKVKQSPFLTLECLQKEEAMSCPIKNEIINPSLSTRLTQCIDDFFRWKAQGVDLVNQQKLSLEVGHQYFTSLEQWIAQIFLPLADEIFKKDINQRNASDDNLFSHLMTRMQNSFRHCLHSLKESQGGFEWVDGVIVQALEAGHCLLLHQVNLCPASVLDRLNGLLEGRSHLPNSPSSSSTSSLFMTESGEGRLIRPHPNFRIFFTADPHYGEISPAMRNRCLEVFVGEGSLEYSGSSSSWMDGILPQAASTLSTIHDKTIETSYKHCHQPLIASPLEDCSLLWCYRMFSNSLKWLDYRSDDRSSKSILTSRKFWLEFLMTWLDVLEKMDRKFEFQAAFQIPAPLVLHRWLNLFLLEIALGRNEIEALIRSFEACMPVSMMAQSLQVVANRLSSMFPCLLRIDAETTITSSNDCSSSSQTLLYQWALQATSLSSVNRVSGFFAFLESYFEVALVKGSRELYWNTPELYSWLLGTSETLSMKSRLFSLKKLSNSSDFFLNFQSRCFVVGQFMYLSMIKFPWMANGLSSSVFEDGLLKIKEEMLLLFCNEKQKTSPSQLSSTSLSTLLEMPVQVCFDYLALYAKLFFHESFPKEMDALWKNIHNECPFMFHTSFMSPLWQRLPLASSGCNKHITSFGLSTMKKLLTLFLEVVRYGVVSRLPILVEEHQIRSLIKEQRHFNLSGPSCSEMINTSNLFYWAIVMQENNLNSRDKACKTLRLFMDMINLVDYIVPHIVSLLHDQILVSHEECQLDMIVDHEEENEVFLYFLRLLEVRDLFLGILLQCSCSLASSENSLMSFPTMEDLLLILPFHEASLCLHEIQVSTSDFKNSYNKRDTCRSSSRNTLIAALTDNILFQISRIDRNFHGIWNESLFKFVSMSLTTSLGYSVETSHACVPFNGVDWTTFQDFQRLFQAIDFDNMPNFLGSSYQAPFLKSWLLPSWKPSMLNKIIGFYHQHGKDLRTLLELHATFLWAKCDPSILYGILKQRKGESNQALSVAASSQIREFDARPPLALLMESLGLTDSFSTWKEQLETIITAFNADQGSLVSETFLAKEVVEKERLEAMNLPLLWMGEIFILESFHAIHEVLSWFNFVSMPFNTISASHLDSSLPQNRTCFSFHTSFRSTAATGALKIAAISSSVDPLVSNSDESLYLDFGRFLLSHWDLFWKKVSFLHETTSDVLSLSFQFLAYNPSLFTEIQSLFWLSQSLLAKDNINRKTMRRHIDGWIQSCFVEKFTEPSISILKFFQQVDQFFSFVRSFQVTFFEKIRDLYSINCINWMQETAGPLSLESPSLESLGSSASNGRSNSNDSYDPSGMGMMKGSTSIEERHLFRGWNRLFQLPRFELMQKSFSSSLFFTSIPSFNHKFLSLNSLPLSLSTFYSSEKALKALFQIDWLTSSSLTSSSLNFKWGSSSSSSTSQSSLLWNKEMLGCESLELWKQIISSYGGKDFSKSFHTHLNSCLRSSWSCFVDKKLLEPTMPPQSAWNCFFNVLQWLNCQDWSSDMKASNIAESSGNHENERSFLLKLFQSFLSQGCQLFASDDHWQRSDSEGYHFGRYELIMGLIQANLFLPKVPVDPSLQPERLRRLTVVGKQRRESHMTASVIANSLWSLNSACSSHRIWGSHEVHAWKDLQMKNDVLESVQHSAIDRPHSAAPFSQLFQELHEVFQTFLDGNRVWDLVCRCETVMNSYQNLMMNFNQDLLDSIEFELQTLVQQEHTLQDSLTSFLYRMKYEFSEYDDLLSPIIAGLNHLSRGLRILLTSIYQPIMEWKNSKTSHADCKISDTLNSLVRFPLNLHRSLKDFQQFHHEFVQDFHILNENAPLVVSRAVHPLRNHGSELASRSAMKKSVDWLMLMSTLTHYQYLMDQGLACQGSPYETCSKKEDSSSLLLPLFEEVVYQYFQAEDELAKKKMEDSQWYRYRSKKSTAKGIGKDNIDINDDSNKDLDEEAAANMRYLRQHFPQLNMKEFEYKSKDDDNNDDGTIDNNDNHDEDDTSMKLGDVDDEYGNESQTKREDIGGDEDNSAVEDSWSKRSKDSLSYPMLDSQATSFLVNFHAKYSFLFQHSHYLESLPSMNTMESTSFLTQWQEFFIREQEKLADNNASPMKELEDKKLRKSTKESKVLALKSLKSSMSVKLRMKKTTSFFKKNRKNPWAAWKALIEALSQDEQDVSSSCCGNDSGANKETPSSSWCNTMDSFLNAWSKSVILCKTVQGAWRGLIFQEGQGDHSLDLGRYASWALMITQLEKITTLQAGQDSSSLASALITQREGRSYLLQKIHGFDKLFTNNSSRWGLLPCLVKNGTKRLPATKVPTCIDFYDRDLLLLLDDSIPGVSWKPHDFYFDPCPEQVSLLSKPLESLFHRLNELLSEFPSNEILLQLRFLTSTLLTMPLTTSLGKMLLSLQLLLRKTEEWQQVAARHVSLDASLKELHSFLAQWRQLELQSWRHLLRNKEIEFSRQAMKKWFTLAKILQTKPNIEVFDVSTGVCYHGKLDSEKDRPLRDQCLRHLQDGMKMKKSWDSWLSWIPSWMYSSTSSKSNVASKSSTKEEKPSNMALESSYLTSFFNLIDTFLRSGVVGEFPMKLHLVRLFALTLLQQESCSSSSHSLFDLKIAYSDNGHSTSSDTSSDSMSNRFEVWSEFRERLANILYSCWRFYGQFLPRVRQFQEHIMAPLQQKVVDESKLSSWDGFSVYSLMEASDRVHRRLVKWVKEYQKEGLEMSWTLLLERELLGDLVTSSGERKESYTVPSWKSLFPRLPMWDMKYLLLEKEEEHLHDKNTEGKGSNHEIQKRMLENMMKNERSAEEGSQSSDRPTNNNEGEDEGEGNERELEDNEDEEEYNPQDIFSLDIFQESEKVNFLVHQFIGHQRIPDAATIKDGLESSLEAMTMSSSWMKSLLRTPDFIVKMNGYLKELFSLPSLFDVADMIENSMTSSVMNDIFAAKLRPAFMASMEADLFTREVFERISSLRQPEIPKAAKFRAITDLISGLKNMGISVYRSELPSEMKSSFHVFQAGSFQAQEIAGSLTWSSDLGIVQASATMTNHDSTDASTELSRRPPLWERAEGYYWKNWSELSQLRLQVVSSISPDLTQTQAQQLLNLNENLFMEVFKLRAGMGAMLEEGKSFQKAFDRLKKLNRWLQDSFLTNNEDQGSVNDFSEKLFEKGAMKWLTFSLVEKYSKDIDFAVNYLKSVHSEFSWLWKHMSSCVGNSSTFSILGDGSMQSSKFLISQGFSADDLIEVKSFLDRGFQCLYDVEKSFHAVSNNASISLRQSTSTVEYSCLFVVDLEQSINILLKISQDSDIRPTLSKVLTHAKLELLEIRWRELLGLLKNFQEEYRNNATLCQQSEYSLNQTIHLEEKSALDCQDERLNYAMTSSTDDVQSASAATSANFGDLVDAALLTFQRLRSARERLSSVATSNSTCSSSMIKNLQNAFESFGFLQLSRLTNQMERIITLLESSGVSMQEFLFNRSTAVVAVRFLPQLISLIERVQVCHDILSQDFMLAFKEISKMNYVTLRICRNLAAKGLCCPPSNSQDNEGEENNGEGNGDSGGPEEWEDLEEGTGMGEGQGKKDVSKEIEDEEQVLGLKEEKPLNPDEDDEEGDDSKKNSENNRQLKKEEMNQGLEMSQDFDGELCDLPDPNERDEDEEDKDSESENDEEMDREMGQDFENDDIIDEKQWSKEDEDNQEDENQKNNAPEKFEKDSQMTGEKLENEMTTCEDDDENNKNDNNPQNELSPDDRDDSDDLDENDQHDEEMENEHTINNEDENTMERPQGIHVEPEDEEKNKEEDINNEGHEFGDEENENENESNEMNNDFPENMKLEGDEEEQGREGEDVSDSESMKDDLNGDQNDDENDQNDESTSNIDDEEKKDEEDLTEEEKDMQESVPLGSNDIDENEMEKEEEKQNATRNNQIEKAQRPMTYGTQAGSNDSCEMVLGTENSSNAEDQDSEEKSNSIQYEVEMDSHSQRVDKNQSNESQGDGKRQESDGYQDGQRQDRMPSSESSAASSPPPSTLQPKKPHSMPNPFREKGDLNQAWHRKLRMDKDEDSDDMDELENEDNSEDIDDNNCESATQDSLFEYKKASKNNNLDDENKESSVDDISNEWQVLGEISEEEAKEIHNAPHPEKESNRESQINDSDEESIQSQSSLKRKRDENSTMEKKAKKKASMDSKAREVDTSEDESDKQMEVEEDRDSSFDHRNVEDHSEIFDLNGTNSDLEWNDESKIHTDENYFSKMLETQKEESVSNEGSNDGKSSKNGEKDTDKMEDIESNNSEDDENDVIFQSTKLNENDRSIDHWNKYRSQTESHANRLCEQLRLLLAPTQVSRLQGDYRSGKRIHMRRVISYLASGYRKDKIWLRRTKPGQRKYEVMMLVDNSRSMQVSGDLAKSALATLALALHRLEVGDLCVATFDENYHCIHPFGQTFVSDVTGRTIFESLEFNADHTLLGNAMEKAFETFQALSTSNTGRSNDSNKTRLRLLFILSDARLDSENRHRLEQEVRKFMESNILVVFLLLDVPSMDNNASVFDMKTIEFCGSGIVSKPYMEDFPFPYYVAIQRVEVLPDVLSQALRQWFELIATQL